MSLATDSIFIDAIRSNSNLIDLIGGNNPRLYDTAIPLPDEDLDNVSPPYIIVIFSGLRNMVETKDETWEGEYDQVDIGVEICAGNISELHELTQLTRETIRDYIGNGETPVYDYELSADAIQYDFTKPCYWQVLHYQCQVENT